MYKRIILVIALAFSSMNFVCSPNQEKQAAQYADTYAHSISAAHNAIDVAHTKNLIDDSDYQAILKDLLAANQGGLDLNTAIRGVSAGTSTTIQVNSIIQLIEASLTDGTAHIKDTNTLAEVQTIVASINVTLTAVEQVYGGK